MDARPASQGNCGQSVWREKLDSEGAQLTGCSLSRQRRIFTTEKHKQMKSTNSMNKQTRAISNDMDQLAEDASALVAATADVAGEKVAEARKRLAAALERGKEIYGRVRQRAVEGARVADEAMHEHPYQAIAIGVGVGALVGYLVSRRCSRNGDRY